MVEGGVAVEPPLLPPWFAMTTPAATPAPTTAPIINSFVAKLSPPTDAPVAANPNTFVCVMMALAVWPAKDADTRICIDPG